MAVTTNKVKFGLKNVHWAVLTSVTGNKPYYDEVKALPGAVTLTLSPEGDSEQFYADNIAYYVTSSNAGYSGTLEVANIPDDFRTGVLGEVEEAEAHILVEKTDAKIGQIALMFQIDGDAKNTHFVFYNVTPGRPETSGETTTNTKTPKTDSIPLTVASLPDGTVRAKTTEQTDDGVIATWYDTVWLPAALKGGDV